MPFKPAARVRLPSGPPHQVNNLRESAPRGGRRWAQFWAHFRPVLALTLLVAAACSDHAKYERVVVFRPGESLSEQIPVDSGLAFGMMLQSIRIRRLEVAAGTACFAVVACEFGRPCAPLVDRRGHQIVVVARAGVRRQLLKRGEPVMDMNVLARLAAALDGAAAFHRRRFLP